MRGRPSRAFRSGKKAGRWEEGDRWVPEPGRNADIFIFAWHPVTSAEADHRDPNQWEFFVLPERELPTQATITLSRIRKLAEPVSFEALATRVKEIADALN